LHIGIVLNSKDDENWEWVSGKKATKIDNPVWVGDVDSKAEMQFG
jgi:hypothetical protein